MWFSGLNLKFLSLSSNSSVYYCRFSQTKMALDTDIGPWIIREKLRENNERIICLIINFFFAFLSWRFLFSSGFFAAADLGYATSNYGGSRLRHVTENGPLGPGPLWRESSEPRNAETIIPSYWLLSASGSWTLRDHYKNFRCSRNKKYVNTIEGQAHKELVYLVLLFFTFYLVIIDSLSIRFW